MENQHGSYVFSLVKGVSIANKTPWAFLDCTEYLGTSGLTEIVIRTLGQDEASLNLLEPPGVIKNLMNAEIFNLS